LLRIIIRRIVVSVPLLFAVSLLVFALQDLLPGDAAVSRAGFDAPPEYVEQLRQEMGLDQPLPVQYGRWLGDLASGSFGTSALNGESVSSVLNQRLPVTLSLVVLTTLVSTFAGVGLGMISSRGSQVTRRMSDVLSVLGLALPTFWIALTLVAIFAVSLGWFPAGGYVAPSTSLTGWMKGLVLPVAALSAHGITVVAKQTREALLDVERSDFVRNLRANGIPGRRILFKHVLRGASIPVLTVSGLLFVSALGGSVVIERIFRFPGLGSLVVDATVNVDAPMLLGVAMYFAVLVVLVNLGLDLSYAWVNPKVRAQ